MLPASSKPAAPKPSYRCYSRSPACSVSVSPPPPPFINFVEHCRRADAHSLTQLNRGLAGTRSLADGCKCATDEMTPSACQVCDFRADEHGQHCNRCLGGKFLHSNRCRDDCDGLEGLIAYAPGNCTALVASLLCRPPQPGIPAQPADCRRRGLQACLSFVCVVIWPCMVSPKT